MTKGPGKHGGFSGFLLSWAEHPEHASGAGGLSALAGLAADVCVAATARDATRLGYPTTMPLTATAFVDAHPNGQQGTLNDLRDAGVHLLGAGLSE